MVTVILIHIYNDVRVHQFKVTSIDWEAAEYLNNMIAKLDYWKCGQSRVQNKGKKNGKEKGVRGYDHR